MLTVSEYKRSEAKYENILRARYYVAVVGLSAALFFFLTCTQEAYGGTGARFSTATGSAQTVVKEARGDNEVRVAAKSAIVVDYDTGNVLWKKNPDKLMYPASTKDGVESDALRLIEWVGTRSPTLSPA